MATITNKVITPYQRNALACIASIPWKNAPTLEGGAKPELGPRRRAVRRSDNTGERLRRAVAVRDARDRDVHGAAPRQVVDITQRHLRRRRLLQADQGIAL